MAERRMFAKSVVDSDDFMELPMSSQTVYFHLAMRADDDGFIGNSKSILRMIGAQEKDLKPLTEKGFVRLFASGVAAIVHWRVHNYIQKDRYKPTVYQQEKIELYGVGEDGSRDEKNVSILDTQVSIGKDSTDKESTGQDKSGEDNSGQDSLNKGRGSCGAEDAVCSRIVELYNCLCTSLPKVAVLSDSRKGQLTRLLGKFSEEQIARVFQKASQCGFLCGKGEKGWKANFDWLIKEENFLKVMEDYYDREPPASRGCCDRAPPAERPSYDIDEYERYSMFD